MLTYLTCALVACASFLAGFIVRHVMRDDRMRELEKSCLAATRAAAEARRALDEERERLFGVLANRDREIDTLEMKLAEAQAALVIERTPSGRPGPEAA